MFEESAVFQKADHGLRRIRLELWAGLMWINFNSDSPSLLDDLGDLPERTAPWKPEELVCVGRRSYPVKANWKLYLENFSDGYHVPFVHKTTLNRKYVSRRDFQKCSSHRSYLTARLCLPETRVESAVGSRLSPFLS